MNNEISTGKKTNGEFTISYQAMGYGGCTPIIDGKPEPSLTFGYATQSDKKACMELIEQALRATNGNVYEAQRYIQNAISVSAAEINADDVAKVDDTEIIIDYIARKAYCGTQEIANCDDLECDMPNEALKALLMARAKDYVERETERLNQIAIQVYSYGDDEYEEEDVEEE